jgi:hypothetical protein
MTKSKRNRVEVTNKKTPQMNAHQKLLYLESKVDNGQKQINILAEEIDKLGQIIQALARRLNASNKASNIPNESIDKIIIEENVRELEGRVNDLISKGILELAAEGSEVSEQCFVIGREIDTNGNVISPRIQFAVMSLVPELKPKFLGTKKGDIISNDHNDNGIEIMDIYNVIQPKQDIVFDEVNGQVEDEGAASDNE